MRSGLLSSIIARRRIASPDAGYQFLTWPSDNAYALWSSDNKRIQVSNAANTSLSAYKSRLISAGVTPTSPQEAALLTFFNNADTNGYLTLLKRMCLPVWGTQAANSICVVSATSLIFNGTVAHTSKKAQSGGGYLDLRYNPTTDGVTAYTGALFYARETNGYDASVDMGCWDGSSSAFWLDNYQTRAYYNCGGQGGGTAGADAASPGSQIGFYSTTSSTHKVRHSVFGSGSVTQLASYSPNLGAVPNYNVCGMCRNNAGTAEFISTRAFYTFGIMKGSISDTLADSFLLALNTLLTNVRA